MDATRKQRAERKRPVPNNYQEQTTMPPPTVDERLAGIEVNIEHIKATLNDIKPICTIVTQHSEQILGIREDTNAIHKWVGELNTRFWVIISTVVISVVTFAVGVAGKFTEGGR